MHSVFIQQCPECSHLLSFTAGHTNIIVCQSCNSTINRNKDGSLVGKPHLTILNNKGIIQPGSTGIWEKKDFTVLGRFRAWFEESVFNYWTIVFSNGDTAWLGEGYGIYSILTDYPLAPKLSSSDFQVDSIGKLRSMDSAVRYILEKKYKSTRWEVEGELYIPDNTVSSFRILEFSNAYGRNLTYFEFGKENIHAFEVAYMNFSDLELKSLRQYENAGKTFTCVSCSQEIHVKTYPYAQSCACISCGMQYALNEIGDFKKEKKTKAHEAVYIPIASSGKINDIDYEVIGYVHKEEVNLYRSKWREYTLYNPQEGYAFLSEYDGHWTYIRENCDSPVLLNQNESSFEVNNEPFLLFNSYNYKVLNGQGEYPYNIFDNQNAKAREFISPPEIWIQERDSKEGITWFFGKHISAKEIKNAFQLASILPKTGIGAVQPVGYINKTKMFIAAVIGFLFLLLIHSFISVNKQNRILLNQTYFFEDSVNVVSTVTEKYILDKKSSNIELKIGAPVRNSWLELSATLVNSVTGKEYTLEKGVEYYFGYAEGESWSEGSTKAKTYFTRVPAGTYFLQLDAAREPGYNRIRVPEFYLTITYDVKNDRNLWWSLFLLLGFIAGKYILISQKERARWSNSPYSTYGNE